MSTRIILFLSLSALILLSTACQHQQSTGPLRYSWCIFNNKHDSLLVFLPGQHDQKEDFLNRGFISELPDKEVDIDIVAVDLTLAYLKNGTAVTGLHEEIISPARKRGYKEIWLVGISLGGLNVLLYAKKHTDKICGIILLSPFLGSKKISDEIALAGGIKKWRPSNSNTLSDEEKLWLWLKETRLDSVYLGTGSEDRFFSLHQQLSQLLPPRNTRIIKGGHRWPVWQELWKYYVTLLQTENILGRC